MLKSEGYNKIIYQIGRYYSFYSEESTFPNMANILDCLTTLRIIINKQI